MLGARRELEIQPVEDDAAWYNCAELKHLDWCEHAPPERVEAGNSSIVQRLISAIRLKCPPVRYVLAYQMAVQSAIPVPGRAATALVRWKISSSIRHIAAAAVRRRCSATAWRSLGNAARDRW